MAIMHFDYSSRIRSTLNLNTLLDLPMFMQSSHGFIKSLRRHLLSVTVCLKKKCLKKHLKRIPIHAYSLFSFCPTKRAACKVKPCPWHDIGEAYRKRYLQDWPCADVMTQRQLLSSVMQVILWPEFELLNKL